MGNQGEALGCSTKHLCRYCIMRMLSASGPGTLLSLQPRLYAILYAGRACSGAHSYSSHPIPCPCRHLLCTGGRLHLPPTCLCQDTVEDLSRRRHCNKNLNFTRVLSDATAVENFIDAMVVLKSSGQVCDRLLKVERLYHFTAVLRNTRRRS